ncbi:MAG: 16S rRNA processing protein RimM [Bacteroidetes bacterium]|nr:16S rRNA processing protein RimM [Bacteroidota bacterium]
MDKQDCFKLGHVSKLHGVKGEIVIALDVDDASRYKKLESVFIEINQQLVPFFIEGITIKNKHAIVKLDGINTIEQAGMINNTEVFLPLSFLPKLDDKKFYFHEIIGFAVNDKTHGNIGTVEAVLEFPGQNIIQVRDGNKNEILIPLRNEFIIKVDRGNKCLDVNTPEGLVDVYLKKGNEGE